MAGTTRLSGAIAIGLLMLVLPATAGAADSYAFNSDAQGWQSAQDSSPVAADWSASAGNPGGSIQFTDTQLADTNTFSGVGTFNSPTFGDERSMYGGTLTYDLKTTASPDLPLTPQVVFRPVSGDTVGCAQQSGSVGSTFATLTCPLAAGDNFADTTTQDPATEAQIKGALNGGSLLILADFDVATGDVATLDNVTFHAPVLHSRVASLAYSVKRKRFSGKLTGQPPDCVSLMSVDIFRKKHGKDPRIGGTTTDSSGKYELKKKANPGKYYATADAQTLQFIGICKAAKSPAVKVG